MEAFYNSQEGIGCVLNSHFRLGSTNWVRFRHYFKLFDAETGKYTDNVVGGPLFRVDSDDKKLYFDFEHLNRISKEAEEDKIFGLTIGDRLDAIERMREVVGLFDEYTRIYPTT